MSNSNHIKHEVDSDIKYLSIPEAGPTILILPNQNQINQLNNSPKHIESQPPNQSEIQTSQTNKTNSPANNPLPASWENYLRSTIRLDWMYDLETATKEFDDPKYSLRFYGPTRPENYFAVNYLSRLAEQIVKSYPYDKWGIFSSHPSGEFNQRDFERTFPVDKFGLTFVSHAHSDHAPVNFSNAKNAEENYNNICPFPIYCTPFTQEFTEVYFKTKMNFQINSYQTIIRKQLELNSWEGTQETNLNVNWPKIQREWQNWQRYLLAFEQQYKSTQKLSLHPQIDQMTYFSPIYFHEAVCWMIPTGHVFGSAGFCIASLTQPIQKRIPNPKMMTADTVFLNEFNPNLRDHLLSPPPLNAHRVIFDGLFADPNLDFPNQAQEITRFLTWLEQELTHNPVILFSWDLGKPQLIVELLRNNTTNQNDGLSSTHHSIQLPDDFALVVGAETKRKLELCAKYGLKLPRILSRQEARTQKYPQNKNYLLIVNPSERGSSTIQSLITKRGAKVVEMSGWCQDPKFRAEHKADAYFTVSDHATYSDLIAYLKTGIIDEIQILQSNSIPLILDLQQQGYRVKSSPKILQSLRGIF